MKKSKKYVTIPTHLIGKVSSTALIIYALLADRQELSVKQGYRFRDCSGYYIIYTEQDLSEVIGISVRTVRRMLTELVGAGLIRTRKQGKGLPQKIYVDPAADEETFSQSADQTASDRTDMACQERTEMACQDRTEMAALTIYQEDSYPDTIYPHPSAPAHTKNKGKQSPSRKKEDEDDITQCIYKSDPSMTADDVEEIKQRISRNKGFIHNARAYIRTVVANYRLEKSIPTPQRAMDGYKPSYDIAEYESESVLDYLSEEELAEIKAEAERLKR